MIGCCTVICSLQSVVFLKFEFKGLIWDFDSSDMDVNCLGLWDDRRFECKPYIYSLLENELFDPINFDKLKLGGIDSGNAWSPFSMISWEIIGNSALEIIPFWLMILLWNLLWLKSRDSWFRFEFSIGDLRLSLEFTVLNGD